MGRTNISWTHWSWNPWYGCHPKSDGCKNCYMFREQRRYGHDPNVVVRSKTTFSDPLKWQRKAEKDGIRELVFTCSWSDFFIEEADPIRDEAWAIIRQCPNLVFQILTKRPERLVRCLPDDWGNGYPNVWMGVSVENQRMAEERVPLLMTIPAVTRFLSCEPLLGNLNIQGMLLHGWHKYSPDIHWVICGGESGPNARPMKYEWAHSLMYQCDVAGTPFFFKQWGEWAPDATGQMVRVGREIAGRNLNGRTYDAMPAVWLGSQ